MLSPTDAASQEPVMGSAQRVIVARARAPRDPAVQYCLDTSALSIQMSYINQIIVTVLEIVFPAI